MMPTSYDISFFLSYATDFFSSYATIILLIFFFFYQLVVIHLSLQYSRSLGIVVVFQRTIVAAIVRTADASQVKQQVRDVVGHKRQMACRLYPSHHVGMRLPVFL